MSITDEKIREAMVAFDKDADGRLLPNELILCQLSLGVFLQPEERAKFDQKASEGPMDYERAAALIKSVSGGRQPSPELAKMFGMFDTKNDGTISAAELKAVLLNLGEVLSAPQIDLITSKFSNSDRINYKELIEYLLN